VCASQDLSPFANGSASACLRRIAVIGFDREQDAKNYIVTEIELQL
jgi:hypothetical protein